MSKFTKSPWSLVEYKNSMDELCCEIVCADRNVIVCDIPDYYLTKDKVNDATLIAAAPELYRALDLCLEQMLFSEGGEPLSFRQAIVEAKQALVKARGE